MRRNRHGWRHERQREYLAVTLFFIVALVIAAVIIFTGG
jgi:hypothetical protein